MALNLHLLRLFAAVAAHGGFSRAAAALHLSQPAISKGVRELEGRLGSPLLERGPGGVRLTEAGQVLARHAATLFAAERAAEEELAALAGLDRGTLHLGASTTIATYLLPEIVGAFHLAHPAVELRLTSANTLAIAETLAARELDIALVEGPVELPGIEAAFWQEDEMVLIASPGHRLAGEAAPVPAAALAAEILHVREPGSGSREVVDTALAAHGVVPRQRLEIGSTESIKHLVAAGLGVGIVSAAAAFDQIALGRLRVIPLRDLVIRRNLNRLRIPGRQPSPAARAFDALLDAGGAFLGRRG
ncbi:LysR family transcriptional regulator [Siccirubricoccus phaeus]|uniref:LysR family transcriptional regulator n=1 Tax=Siccirubricoccus phaeus TaxID=2595053 RepID=UPI0011F20796|nr:LysR family transcriptional regulator [Siccirubricoccus phaeus]